MDPTSVFFVKLRRMATTLESETAKLQRSFENRNNEEDGEATAKGTRAFHELKCEFVDLKGQVQNQLAQQKVQENEVNTFIKACRLMEQRVSKDIQTLTEHWEKYGYQVPRDAQGPNKEKTKDSETTDEAGSEGGTGSTDEDDGEGHGEPGDDLTSSPVTSGPRPIDELLRTPQLSDFGLSEMQLKRDLGKSEWLSELPPMPEITVAPPSFNTPAPPTMSLTSKCALHMDDDELRTPEMHIFDISEQTKCLKQDLTVELLRKDVESQRLQNKPVDFLKESLPTKGLKMKTTNGHRSPSEQVDGEPELSVSPGHTTTPDVPEFQTPYVNRLFSHKKQCQSEQQPKPVNVPADDDLSTFDLTTPRHNGVGGSKRPWEYNVPNTSMLSEEEEKMPEMPNLQSLLGMSLQSKTAKVQKRTKEQINVYKDLSDNSLETDGATVEFKLGTPRMRMDQQEPSTPEMPDLSSVTQDICKLVSQAQLKRTDVAVVKPNVRPAKDVNSAACLSLVSESEYLRLPNYLRQISLNNLNQMVHSINSFITEFPGRGTELQFDELKRIGNVGAKTPVYILCLTELNRLQHVRGARDTSVYMLCAGA
ncbi:SKA complex subunit 3 isoform X2 [Cynoglossus semilaevis]|uniref:SKA complex subunit 3 isoform X2 n=1 Tax=Cynoglossus semilaevis TaxID=244447 RepID=UPI000496FDFF|nr:spindle and kinetochore-associated protein 3 isoform X2 [Cynoglossus semilaevis]